MSRVTFFYQDRRDEAGRKTRPNGCRAGEFPNLVLFLVSCFAQHTRYEQEGKGRNCAPRDRLQTFRWPLDVCSVNSTSLTLTGKTTWFSVIQFFSPTTTQNFKMSVQITWSTFLTRMAVSSKLSKRVSKSFFFLATWVRYRFSLWLWLKCGRYHQWSSDNERRGDFI